MFSTAILHPPDPAPSAGTHLAQPTTSSASDLDPFSGIDTFERASSPQLGGRMRLRVHGKAHAPPKRLGRPLAPPALSPKQQRRRDANRMSAQRVRKRKAELLATTLIENDILRQALGGQVLSRTASSTPVTTGSMPEQVTPITGLEAPLATLTSSAVDQAPDSPAALSGDLAQREARARALQMELQQRQRQQEDCQVKLARWQVQLRHQQTELDRRQTSLAWQQATSASRVRELASREVALQRCEAELQGWLSDQPPGAAPPAAKVAQVDAATQLAELLQAPPRTSFANLLAHVQVLAGAADMMRQDPALTAACLLLQGHQPGLPLSDLWLAARQDGTLRQQRLREAYASEGLLPAAEAAPDSLQVPPLLVAEADSLPGALAEAYAMESMVP